MTYQHAGKDITIFTLFILIVFICWLLIHSVATQNTEENIIRDRIMQNKSTCGHLVVHGKDNNPWVEYKGKVVFLAERGCGDDK